MTPEIIAAVGTAAAGLLTTWNARQGRQIRELRAQVEQLTTWRLRATAYIGSLLYLMSSAGMTPPAPPPELGLTPDQGTSEEAA